MFLIILPDVAEDDDLIVRLRQRDKSVIPIIYERYFTPLYQYARLKVGDRALAQDIVSEVFLTLIQTIGKQNAPRDNLRAWLFTVARHAAYRTYRSAPQLPLEDVEEWMSAPAESDPGNLLSDTFQLERVRYALRMLTADHQEVLILRFGQRLSLQETADLMGKTTSAIKSLQFRAVETLRSILIEPEASNG